MISITDQELTDLIRRTPSENYRRRQCLSVPETIPQEVFFVESGLVRVCITDQKGTEHSIHFAREGEFICDYSAFMRKEASKYTLQALEDTRVVILPRSAVEWGYANLQEGQKLGRLIAEYYFVYHDNRIKNQYLRSPKERYDGITQVFPNIHNRVPQHMIASYLGITPIHLSRLKKKAGSEV